MDTLEITWPSLGLGYLLLIVPLGVMLWARLPLIGKTVVSIIRMTVQLLFVGFYLKVVFEWDNVWLNAAWLLIMIAVADISIIRGCGLKIRHFAGPLFVALLAGTVVPLLFFLAAILRQSQFMDAQYAIPISGMILGNCLRADIIGLRSFYEDLQKHEKPYLYALAQGATQTEAASPYLRNAFHSAIAPFIATMATIGLVSLPGMMTGVILGGANPMTAIKYQILIMIAIFAGTAITVALAIRLTFKVAFTPQGILDRRMFKRS